MKHVLDYHAKRDEEALQERRADLTEVLSTPAGRRVFIALRNGSGLFDRAPAPKDGREEWIGRRDFGLSIIKAFRDAAPALCRLAEEEAEHAEDVERAKLEEAERLDREEISGADPFGNKTQEKP